MTGYEGVYKVKKEEKDQSAISYASIVGRRGQLSGSSFYLSQQDALSIIELPEFPLVISDDKEDKIKGYCEKQIENIIEYVENSMKVLKSKDRLHPEGPLEYSGSTYTSVIVDTRFSDAKIVTNNLGDGTIHLMCDKEIKLMNDIDKPNNKDEVKRIKKMGGKIQNNRIIGDKVGQKLAISAAIGDSCYKGTRHTPKIGNFRVIFNDKKQHLLIIASDGLTETLSLENLLEEEKNHPPLAVSLVKNALSRKSNDNITAIVVNLNLLPKGKVFEFTVCDGHGFYGDEIALAITRQRAEEAQKQLIRKKIILNDYSLTGINCAILWEKLDGFLTQYEISRRNLKKESGAEYKNFYGRIWGYSASEKFKAIERLRDLIFKPELSVQDQIILKPLFQGELRDRIEECCKGFLEKLKNAISNESLLGPRW